MTASGSINYCLNRWFAPSMREVVIKRFRVPGRSYSGACAVVSVWALGGRKGFWGGNIKGKMNPDRVMKDCGYRVSG